MFPTKASMTNKSPAKNSTGRRLDGLNIVAGDNLPTSANDRPDREALFIPKYQRVC